MVQVSKKVLIISFHYLPEVMAASLRMHAWAKYLKKSGWEPTILTHSANERNRQHPIEEQHLYAREFNQEINCPVYRVPHRQKYRRIWNLRQSISLKSKPTILDVAIRKLLSFGLRNLLLIPDEKVGWFDTAYNAALTIMKQHQFDVILATGAPWTDFKVAKHLSKYFNIPWIADYRDPWTQPTTMGVKLEYVIWKLVSCPYERMLAKTAAALIHVSGHWKDVLAAKQNRKVYLIPNGFDPENFTTQAAYQPSRDVFTISFIGTLHTNTVTNVFIEGFHKFIEANDLTPKFCKLQFVGSTQGHRVIENSYEKFSQIAKFVSYSKPVSQRKANELMCRSHILLLFPLDMKGCIPAKTFEYLASGRPILSSPRGRYHQSIRKIFEKTKAGVVLGSPEEVAGWLNLKFEEFINEGIVRSSICWTEVQKYRRDNQVAYLIEIIKESIAKQKQGLATQPEQPAGVSSYPSGNNVL